MHKLTGAFGLAVGLILAVMVDPACYGDTGCKISTSRNGSFSTQKVVCEARNRDKRSKSQTHRALTTRTASRKSATKNPEAIESSPRAKQVSYCDKGIVYYHFYETGLTMTAGIACDTPSRGSTKPRSNSSSRQVPQISEQEAAQIASNQLDLTVPELKFGPDWKSNEWQMMAVGYPLWVWTDKSTALQTTRTIAGMTISLSASPPTLRVDYGDGTTQYCATTTPYTWEAWQKAANHESPTCGHTYLKKGDYPVTVTATWQVKWSGPGHSGTIPVTLTSSAATIPIGELESVLVPARSR